MALWLTWSIFDHLFHLPSEPSSRLLHQPLSAFDLKLRSTSRVPFCTLIFGFSYHQSPMSSFFLVVPCYETFFSVSPLCQWVRPQVRSSTRSPDTSPRETGQPSRHHSSCSWSKPSRKTIMWLVRRGKAWQPSSS